MADLLAESESKVRGFSVGQKVKGKVVAKTPKSLILDIGGKGEGVVAEKAFSEARDFAKTLKVGDEVTGTVLIPETQDGTTILSLRQAVFDASWGKLEKAKKDKTPIAVFGKGVNPSGVTVDAEGVLGFIPGSQLGRKAAKNPQNLVGKYFKAEVIEVDRLANKVVLSEKAVSEASDIKKAQKALEKIKEGEVYEGEVTTLANFGCFVRIDLKDGRTKVPVEGLVHISELSWGKVGQSSDIVKEGQKVKVKIIGLRDDKLALSIKQAEKDPWSGAEKKFKPETKAKGKVVKVSDFGVFVELIPGVEGLIHMTKIPPATKLEVGQEIEVYIEEIDAKNKKLSLGIVLTQKPVGYK